MFSKRQVAASLCLVLLVCMFLAPNGANSLCFVLPIAAILLIASLSVALLGFEDIGIRTLAPFRRVVSLRAPPQR